MNNIALEGFMSSVEETFGKYKSGMSRNIRLKLSNLSQDGFDTLFSYLVNNYDLARPPSLKFILGELYRYNIPLNKIVMIGVSVCEFCHEEYSQDDYKCPHCGKLRKYGITRLKRRE